MRAHGRILPILRKHLPKLKIDDGTPQAQDSFLYTVLMSGESYLPVVVKDSQKKALKEYSQSLMKAQAAFNKLDPKIRDQLSGAYDRNTSRLSEVSPGLVLAGSHRAFPLAGVLNALILALTGLPAERKLGATVHPVGLVDALELANSEIDKYIDLSPQQIKHDVRKKITLVESAREFWKASYDTAPAGGTETPFIFFLADLIDVLGFEWDAESTLRSWKEASKRIAAG